MISLTAKDIFTKYTCNAKKALGQNYIFSSDINCNIVNFAGDISNFNVLEIGPGPGGLTLEILKRRPNRLTVIELDDNWAQVWNDIKEQESNLHVIHKDVLAVDFDQLEIDVIISNLPYNVSSKILIKLLPNFERYKKLVLMFQKELADRIISHYDTKTYGRLSVLSQLKSDIKKCITLSPNCFTPPPKVLSSVLLFTPKQNVDADFSKMNKLTTIAFANRRKQLVKALAREYGSENILDIFERLNIRPDARAEQLDINKFIQLANIL